MAIAVGCAPFRSEGFACVDGFIPGVGLASGAPLSPPSAHEETAAQRCSPSAGVGGASDFPSLRASGLVSPASQCPGGTGASSCSVTAFYIANYVMISWSGCKLGLPGRVHHGECHELL